MKASITAAKYLGQTELPKNMGFKDKSFWDKMKRIAGFVDGHAWCSYFAELVWKESFPEYDNLLNTLFSASATKTFQNFSQSNICDCYSIEDHSSDKIRSMILDGTIQAGSLVVWRYGSSWKGHIAILEKYNRHDNTIETIDGNSNDLGWREGVAVVKRKRPLIFSNFPNSLNIVGFISTPKQRSIS